MSLEHCLLTCLVPTLCRFKPQENVLDAYVVEGADGKLTDMVSYYTLPSNILGHPKYTELKAAYMYYTGV